VPVPDEPALAPKLAAAVKAQTGRDIQEVVGETRNLLEGVEPAVRGRETAAFDQQ